MNNKNTSKKIDGALEFGFSMKNIKFSQCKCGKPKQCVGFSCDACGSIVKK